MKILISETTREEREKIVEDSLGNMCGLCDGCSMGLADMYQPYIDGEKELREINMAFQARYIHDGKREVTGGGNSCGYVK